MFAIAGLTAWEVEDIRVAEEGESFTVGAYEVTLADVRKVEGPNYISTMAEMRLARGGREVAVLYPEKRVYPVAETPTTVPVFSIVWMPVFVWSPMRLPTWRLPVSTSSRASTTFTEP